VPFLALRRAAARILLPSADETSLMVTDPPGAEPHEVTCMLDVGSVRGRLMLSAANRISDHLMHQAGFVLLRDADVGPNRAPAPFAYLNMTAIVAVSEVPPVRAVGSAHAASRLPGVEPARLARRA
jgi:hypothetical protein